ncbi:Unknown protein sequence [Pseudomonas syringae pv. maculicola]|nr:Unknown protein sequence [Pseudomonas syringae pv. maculicola]
MVLLVLHGVSSGGWRQLGTRAKKVRYRGLFVLNKILCRNLIFLRLFYRRKKMQRPEVSGNFVYLREYEGCLELV